MTPVMQWIAAVLGAGGGGKFIWDIFTARSQNRKNNTDSTVLLVNSAAGYADGLVRRIESINARFDEFRREQESKNQEQARKNEEQNRRNRAQDLLLLEHSRWDHQVVSTLKTKGITVAEPPPLFLTEMDTP